MTTVPHSPHTDNLMTTSYGGNETDRHQSSRLPAASMTLGALSIAAFWILGLGFVLGVAAAVCGTIAMSRPAVADDEAASLRALLGIIAGAAGIIVSAGAALLPMLAQR